MIDDKSAGPTPNEITPIAEDGWKGLN
jgi:hypothetical protein